MILIRDSCKNNIYNDRNWNWFLIGIKLPVGTMNIRFRRGITIKDPNTHISVQIECKVSRNFQQRFLNRITYFFTKLSGKVWMKTSKYFNIVGQPIRGHSTECLEPNYINIGSVKSFRCSIWKFRLPWVTTYRHGSSSEGCWPYL